jgi:hypothetical protein
MSADVARPRIIRRRVQQPGQRPFWTLTGAPEVVAGHVRVRMRYGEIAEFAAPKLAGDGEVVVAVRYAPHADPDGVGDPAPATVSRDQLVRRIGMVAIAVAIICVLLVAGFLAVWVAHHLVLVIGSVILAGAAAGYVCSRVERRHVSAHCPGCKG